MRPDPVDGDGIRLRLYTEGDLDDLTAACDDPSTARFTPGLPSPYTPADARWWITEGAPAAWRAGGAAYAIGDPTTGRLLGGLGLGQVVPYRAQAEIGYWVAPWARRRGVATAATRALTGAAFAAGLRRLELLTRAENPASQRVALAAGFRREGVRRSVSPNRVSGRSDLIAWARCADDPPGPTPRLLPDLPSGGLTDGLVTLRLLGPADADVVHRLHRLPEVVANRVPPTAPERPAIDRRCAWAESHLLAGESADLLILADGTALGGCMLRYDEPVTGQAMIGISLLPEGRGRGLSTRAVRLLAGWAFRSAGIARLWAGAAPGNLPSQRMLEQVGFRREGLTRGRLPGPTGERVDTVTFGLLPSDLVEPSPADPSELPAPDPTGPPV